MAFIDESDLKQPEPDVKVVYQQAPRSKLVPMMLVTLNVGVLALVAVFALPYLGDIQLGGGDGEEAEGEKQISADDLDPSQLMTPTGRKLDVVEFGGYLFEVTRIAYSNVPSARTVTITVPAARPGEDPQQGIYHVHESFAGGDLRIVDITRNGVMLAHKGKQKMFTVDGATPSDVWDKTPPGKSYIPPTNTDIIPDLPDGAQRPPRNPVYEEEPEPEDGERPKLLEEVDDDDLRTIDDLPDVRQKKLPRDVFSDLRKNLPDIFADDFVFGTALERDTRAAIGLEILRIKAESPFFTYGLQTGDVILSINDERVIRWTDLDDVSRQIGLFRDEIRLEMLREGEPITFVFQRGLPD